MTIQEIKSFAPRVINKPLSWRGVNGLSLASSIVVLRDKLEELGLAELRWHDSVASYSASVANSGKRIVGEYFREDLNVLPPSRFFGMTGHDHTGKTVCTIANRYDDISGWDLREYIQRFWYRNYRSENGGQALLAPESVPFTDGLTGPFGYIGDLSVDPALSGKEFAAYFARLTVLTVFQEWKPDYIYAWMAKHHVAKGLAVRWGFPIMWPGGFMWDIPPANPAYSDLCFVGCPRQAVALIASRPLDIGVTSDPKSSKA